MFDRLPDDWQRVLADDLTADPAGDAFHDLARFVAAERAEHTVYPPETEVFNAFYHTPFDRVRVLLLGQDPYHGPKQAHGLCFSVRPGISPPPSLKNILKERQSDLGLDLPDHGCLTAWADRGVMLLNAVLTVRAGEARSHAGQGWERFTDAVIRRLGEKRDPVVFLLWGGYARRKAGLIDTTRHPVLEAAHPSPLSAHQGFFGSRPFSRANAALTAIGQPELDWSLPPLAELTAS